MFGLTELEIQKIKSVFAEFPEIEKAIVYGSRAKGNFHNGSDIDLSLTGKDLSLKILLRIENQLDDLLLPYNFDISILSKIENPDLVNHIERIGKVFYERS